MGHIQNNEFDTSKQERPPPPMLLSEHRLNYTKRKRNTSTCIRSAKASPCRPRYLNNAMKAFFQQKGKNSNNHITCNFK